MRCIGAARRSSGPRQTCSPLCRQTCSSACARRRTTTSDLSITNGLHACATSLPPTSRICRPCSCTETRTSNSTRSPVTRGGSMTSTTRRAARRWWTSSGSWARSKSSRSNVAGRANAIVSSIGSLPATARDSRRRSSAHRDPKWFADCSKRTRQCPMRHFSIRPTS